MADEHVNFVPKPGVTIYSGRARFDHDPKKPVRLPKAQADAWDDLRHKAAVPPAIAAAEPAAKPKKSAAAELPSGPLPAS